jgi:ATP-dependent Clp protease ATP-binding subunit ClpA
MTLLSFDDARTTMADGTLKDLSPCYVIMTSNLGAAEAAQMVSSGYSAIRRKVIHEAEQVFRKETVARFTSSIVMNSLDFDTQKEIARALLSKELALQSAHCRRWVEIAGESVLSFVVSKGFSPDLGARNIRKTVERYVGDAFRSFLTISACVDEAFHEFETVDDLWSRALELSVEGDKLVLSPLVRSASLGVLLEQPPRIHLQPVA